MNAITAFNEFDHNGPLHARIHVYTRVHEHTHVSAYSVNGPLSLWLAAKCPQWGHQLTGRTQQYSNCSEKQCTHKFRAHILKILLDIFFCISIHSHAHQKIKEKRQWLDISTTCLSNSRHPTFVNPALHGPEFNFRSQKICVMAIIAHAFDINKFSFGQKVYENYGVLCHV